MGSSPHGLKLTQLNITYDCMKLCASLSPLRNKSGVEMFLVSEDYLSGHVLYKI